MNLIEALIRTGSATTMDEANEIVEDMRERVYAGEDPELVLWEYGFEPDYIFDIL
jgi:hypothetical protein